MPTFLPLTAITRSQRVRIAGQYLKPGKIYFVDLGIVDAPGEANEGAPITTEAGATKTGKLTEAYYAAYVLTSVDVSGRETTASYPVNIKAPAEAEVSVILKWGAVPHAKKYRIYANVATGNVTSAAAAEAEALKLIGETESLTFTDTGQTRKATTPPTVNTTEYNVAGYAWSTHKELQNHFAIGAVQQLGGYTPSNLDYIPVITPSGWELKLESEKVKVVKSIVEQRSTGRVFAVGNELETSAFKSGGATKTVLAIIVYNSLNNKLETVQAAEKTVEVPTQAEFETLAKTLPTTSQILWVVKTKIKVVTNVTSTYIKGYSTPSLGDFANAPVVSFG